jgi:hypothetical protein
MDGTKIEVLPFKEGATLWDIYNSDAVPKDMPVLCLLNDEPVMRADWGQLVDPNNAPLFVTLPSGGNGGFKTIIRVVALLAIAIAAPYIAPVIAGVGATAGTLAAISAGITLVGGLIINMIIPAAPPPKPGDAAEVSPTYNTSAQGTRARLFQPVPVQYGRIKMTPDWASDPFQTYSDNQQVIYQLLCVGVGRYHHEKVFVGETEIWNDVSGYTGNLSSIELAWIEPGAPVTLFPGIVFTSTEVGGQELRRLISTGDFTFTTHRATFSDNRADAFNEFLVGDTVDLTGAGANNGTYLVTALDPGNTKGWAEFSPNFPAPGSVSGVTFTVRTAIGPFAACAPTDTIFQIVFDIGANGGLGEANNTGGLDSLNVSFQMSYQLIDATNTPIGPWVDLPIVTISGNTPQPRRYSYPFDVPVGRYWAKVQRTSASSLKTGILDNIQWLGLRGFIPDDNVYPNVTLLAIKFNVGEQITSATSRQISVVQTRMLEAFDGTTWLPEAPTRSIAWAAADMLRDTLYGAGWTDSMIDIAKLKSMEDTWTITGDTFDGVFDSKQAFWNALISVLAVGRAFPLVLGSSISFDRDEPKSLIKGVITPRTMLSGSFNMDYIFFDEDSPDDVIIEFFNEDTWQDDEIQCTLPGSLSENPARIKMFGMVNRTRVFKYGMYQAASNFYRRIIAGLDTEMVGRLYLRNSLVLLSHDLPKWGFTGDIIEPIGPREFALSDDVDWSTPDTYYMAIRNQFGGGWGPVIVTEGSDGSVLINAASLAAVEAVQGPIAAQLIFDDDDAGREPTKYIIGAGLETYTRKFLVSTTQPNGIESVSVLLQNYDERVYDDYGLPPPPPDPSGPNVTPDKPVIAYLALSQNPNANGNVVTVFAAWQPAPGANTYILEISYDNANWSQVYSGSTNGAQFNVNSGPLFARVAGIGKLRGDYATASGSFGSPSSAPGAVSGLATVEAGDGTITTSWAVAARALSYKTDVWTETSLGSGIFDILKLTRNSAASPSVFAPTEVAASGGPWTRYQARVNGINNVGSGPVATTNFVATGTAAPVINGAGTTMYTPDHSPFISGTAPALSSVTIYADTFPKAVVQASASGTWSTSIPGLTTGTRAVNARATGPGGVSALSTTLSVLIYDDDAATAPYVAAMTIQPTDLQRYRYNNLIAGLRAGGSWAKMDAFYILGSHDAQAARLNAKNPALYPLTATASPVFTADRGYKGTGVGSTAGGYLQSTFTPSTAGGLWTLNSAHLMVYVRTAATTVLALTSAEIGVAGAYIYTKDNTAGNIRTSLNDGTVSNTAAGSPTGTGLFITNRTVSTGYDKYHDAVAQAAAVVTSTALPASGVAILRANSASYSDAQALFASWGGALTAGEITAMNTTLLAHKTAIGA